MSRRLPFFGGAVALAVAALVNSGCVDRRFVIESDPPGAIVNMNGKRIGATPLDQQFPYYGKYRFEFVRDGFETVVVEEQVRAPWYEYFPIEFIVENLWPWTVHDIHYIPSKPTALPPMQVIPAEAIFGRAQQLQSRGQALVAADGMSVGAPAIAAPGPLAPNPAPTLPQQLPPGPSGPTPQLAPVPIRQ